MLVVSARALDLVPSLIHPGPKSLFVVSPPSDEAQILDTSPKPTGVIVADDDPMIRNILLARLKDIDQDVFLANNGLEAVILASRMQASLVMLDVEMPELDGLLACAQIRQLPGYAGTPIVMLTLHDTEQAQNAASRAGATMFLVKPFSSAALMLALSRFLRIDNATLETIQVNAVRAGGGRVFRRLHS